MENALDHGVIGDGVTDDTVAIQTLLDNYFDVYFPNGTYLISDHDSDTVCVQVKESNYIRGAGNSTIFKAVASSGAHVFNIDSRTNVVLEDFTIDGNENGSAHGVRGEGCIDLVLRNLNIIDVGGYGVGLQQEVFERCLLDSLYIKNSGGDGIDLKNEGDSNRAVIITNCVVDNPGTGSGTTEAGFDFRGVVLASNLTVLGLSGDRMGIRFRETGVPSVGVGAHYSSLNGFYIEGTGETSIGVYIPGDYVKVNGGTILGDVFKGVSVNGAHNIVQAVIARDADTGFELSENATYSIINGCEVRNGGLGFKIQADRVRIVNNLANGCTGAGIEITSLSDKALIDGNIFISNGASNIKNGTNTLAGSNIGY